MFCKKKTPVSGRKQGKPIPRNGTVNEAEMPGAGGKIFLRPGLASGPLWKKAVRMI
jgi:hypothetical protein